jgi:hypothetical protein
MVDWLVNLMVKSGKTINRLTINCPTRLTG